MGLFDSISGGASKLWSNSPAGYGLQKIMKIGEKDGINSGNDMYKALMSDADRNTANQSLRDLLAYQGDENTLDPTKSSAYATKQVMESPLLSQLFGKDGTLSRTTAEEQNLASRGYSLQPKDYEAYGQGMGNIARNFDSAEGNLAQALAARGLSNSGIANKSFAISQGNKLEQLGQLQRQIANDRIQTNIARLGQTRQFLNTLGAQAQNAVQDQFGRQLASENARFGQTQSKANAGLSWLGQGNQALADYQTQANSQWAQNRATEREGLGGQLTAGFLSTARAAPGAAANKAMGSNSFNSSGATTGAEAGGYR